MTTAGRLAAEFAAFKAEMESRVSKLEELTDKKKNKKDNKDIVIETKNDDIIGFDFEGN